MSLSSRRAESLVAKRAAEYFHGPQKYNCAQAVLCTFRKYFKISQLMIDEYKKHGSGRNEKGYCGALYAAISLLEDETEIRELSAKFAALAGSVKCREIRRLKKMSCAQCVEVTALLLKEHIDA